MKIRHLLPLLCLTASCTAPERPEAKKEPAPATAWTPPPPGTVVAADSMRIQGDRLNHFYFTVKLLPSRLNEKSTTGFVYDIQADFGPNTADGHFTMPKGGQHLKPLLRPAPDGSYTYLIGFIPGPGFGGDTTFHEYYEVRASKGTIEIRALKGYVLE